MLAFLFSLALGNCLISFFFLFLFERQALPCLATISRGGVVVEVRNVFLMAYVIKAGAPRAAPLSILRCPVVLLSYAAGPWFNCIRLDCGDAATGVAFHNC
jgi:hypothetical protein